MIDKKNTEFVLQNIKGAIDFLPEKQIVRDKIISVLKSNFSKYGYMPLETPILNYFDLLSYKYGEGAEILSEIYKLKDQGSRNLGLRFDLTVPFCKVIGMNKNLSMPFRRYEIGKVFRDGPVKAGRAREFYQCDIDVVGIDGRLIEVEQMQMVIDIFKELEIDIIVKWNNRKLMIGMLSYLQVEASKIDAVVGLIDRLEKISRAELLKEFQNLEIEEERAEKILNLFNKKLEDYVEIFAETTNTNLKEGLEECLEIQKYIDELGLNDSTLFMPTLARGLNIYTNTVFEFFDKQNRISSSLGGGGRYNKIITEFMDNGIEYPAVGLSFGLEPIYYILSNEYKESFIDVLIVPLSTEIECLKLAKELREVNAKVVVDFSNKKVKKSFEYANKNNVKYVIVVGEDEINQGYFTIKDMIKSEQYKLSKEELIEFVQKNI